MNVGFIGLGAMGAPMAARLAGGGHALAVWARRPEAAATLLRDGATWCESPAALAARSEVVFTMVMAGRDVEAVVLGPDGVAQGAKPGTVVVDCSTIAPATTRRVAAALHARGMHMLDAPVSGGLPGATNGTLSIMVGGDAAVFERMRPLLERIGTTLVHIGESGAGSVAKAANQLSLVVTIQGVAEAIALAVASGVDVAPVLEAMAGGMAGSRMLEIIGTRMQERQFEMGIDASLHHKDSNIVLECAAESHTPVPAAALAAQAFNALTARPGVRWDSAAVRLVIEDLCGLHGDRGD